MGNAQINNASQGHKAAAQQSPTSPSAPTHQQVAAKPYQPACSHPADGNEASLCASISQARSAIEQASAARAANEINSSLLYLNIAGVLLIALTLIATAWAAWSASRATKVAIDAAQDAENAIAIASRNADAAAQHVEIAKDTAKRQLRGYIYIDQEGVPYPHLTSTDFQMKNKIANVGQTPVSIEKILTKSFRHIFPLPSSFELPEGWKNAGGAGTLHNGAPMDAPTNCSALSQQDLSRLIGMTATHRIWVVVRVEYRDIFGDFHVEQICGGTFWPMPDRPRFEFANAHHIST